RPREDEQAVVREQELLAEAGVELQRVEQARLARGDVDGLDAAVRDGEERRAVRLRQVGLVHALLLDVRAGVVDALGLAAVGGGGARDSDRERRDAPAAEAPGADQRGRVRPRIDEQLAAGAERDEARRARRLAARRRPRRS